MGMWRVTVHGAEKESDTTLQLINNKQLGPTLYTAQGTRPNSLDKS